MFSSVYAYTRRRRLFQFGLRTVLLVVTLLAVWLGIETNRARKEREAIRVANQLHATIRYDYQFDSSGKLQPSAKIPGPAWLRGALGDEYFGDVVHLTIPWGFEPSPTDLRILMQLHKLRSLNLSRFYSRGISDEGLEDLANLRRLEALDLTETDVGDETVARIGSLSNLRVLSLSGTNVSDDGLEHLTRLPNLEILRLSDTSVTDRGLEHLRHMPNLKEVWLLRTYEVTLAGLADLQDARPNLSLKSEWSQPW